MAEVAEIVAVPEYVTVRIWKDGKTCSYYWIAPKPAREAGFQPAYRNLGTARDSAYATAAVLLEKLESFRTGRKLLVKSGGGPVEGSSRWLSQNFIGKLRKESQLSPPTIREYEKKLRLADDHVLKEGPFAGIQFGDLPVTAIDEPTAQILARELMPRPAQSRKPKRTEYVQPSEQRRDAARSRTCKLTMDTLRSRHNRMRKEVPAWVPKLNPFSDMGIKFRKSKPQERATPEMAAALLTLTQTKGAVGHSIGTLVMATMVWMDRAECIPGELTVDDYRPPHRPNEIRIFHGKTEERIWAPLLDHEGRPFYPKLLERLDNYKAMMTAGPLIPYKIVDGVGVPWNSGTLAYTIRKYLDELGFPIEISLRSFRKGGISTAGDAGATHSEIRAQTGHTSGVLDKYIEPTPKMLQEMHRKQSAYMKQAIPGVF